jgi:hypothetical protein
VAGPLPVCPAYWSPAPRCRCGKHTSRLRITTRHSDPEGCRPRCKGSRWASTLGLP